LIAHQNAGAGTPLEQPGFPVISSAALSAAEKAKQRAVTATTVSGMPDSFILGKDL
jgi:hypothetical protein